MLHVDAAFVFLSLELLPRSCFIRRFRRPFALPILASHPLSPLPFVAFCCLLLFSIRAICRLFSFAVRCVSPFVPFAVCCPSPFVALRRSLTLSAFCRRKGVWQSTRYSSRYSYRRPFYSTPRSSFVVCYIMVGTVVTVLLIAQR